MKKLKSRKFLMALVGGLLVVLNKGLDMGLPEDAITNLVWLLSAYILGESAVDAVASRPK